MIMCLYTSVDKQTGMKHLANNKSQIEYEQLGSWGHFFNCWSTDQENNQPVTQ